MGTSKTPARLAGVFAVAVPCRGRRFIPVHCRAADRLLISFGLFVVKIRKIL
jgi:hypothetical protein